MAVRPADRRPCRLHSHECSCDGAVRFLPNPDWTFSQIRGALLGDAIDPDDDDSAGLLGAGLLVAAEPEATKEDGGGFQMPPAELIGELTKRLLDDPDGRMADLGKRLLGENGGDMLFYYPTRDEPQTPRDLGLNFERMEFSSKDGTKLHGWFIPAKGAAAKATIVFSHGNAGSLGHHLPFVSWLPAEGFNLVMYDYRGFGKSEGKIDRKGMTEDAAAAFRAAASRDRCRSGESYSRCPTAWAGRSRSPDWPRTVRPDCAGWR